MKQLPRATRIILQALNGPDGNDRLSFLALLRAVYPDRAQRAYARFMRDVDALDTAYLIRYASWSPDETQRVIVLTDFGREYLEYRGPLFDVPEMGEIGPRLRNSLLAERMS